MQPLSYEEFLERFYDEVYITYMETGAYYDTRRELFDEMMYEDYLRNPERWENQRRETNM